MVLLADGHLECSEMSWRGGDLGVPAGFSGAKVDVPVLVSWASGSLFMLGWASFG